MKTELEQKNYENEELMNVKDMAKFLRVPDNTAYKMLLAGTIPSIKMGKLRRIKKTDLVSFINGSRVNAVPPVISDVPVVKSSGIEWINSMVGKAITIDLMASSTGLPEDECKKVLNQCRIDDSDSKVGTANGGACAAFRFKKIFGTNPPPIPAVKKTAKDATNVDSSMVAEMKIMNQTLVELRDMFRQVWCEK